MSQNGQITWTNERRKLCDLVPWRRNPRQIKTDQAKRLIDSFESFNQVEPIAIGPDGDIYNGHQRLNVLRQEYGPDYEVDVRVASRALTEKEREKLTVYLHRGAVGEWDFDILANEFELPELLEWGFEPQELDLSLWADEPQPDPGPQLDRAEELRERWGVQTGQLWRINQHELYCGDAMDYDFGAIDGIITDPPYDMDAGRVVAILDRISSRAAILTGGKQAFDLATRWYMRHDFVWYHKTPRLFLSLQIPVYHHHHCLMLTRDDSIPLGWTRPRSNYSSVIQCDHEFFMTAMGHSKAPDIFVEMLSGFAWRTAADPFLGAGATVIACDRQGIKCVAAEIDPGTFAVALERLSAALNGVAELATDYDTPRGGTVASRA